MKKNLENLKKEKFWKKISIYRNLQKNYKKI